jgi:hypothetical protein
METYKELIAFLQKASDTKLMKFHTARTRKTAIGRIFIDSVFENISIFELNINDVIDEFQTKNPGISEDTIKTYKSRFNTALKDYIRYEKLGETQNIDVNQQYIKEVKEKANKAEVVNLPCPIRKGEHIIKINNLPMDLTEEELNRLIKLIKDFTEMK